MKSKLIKKEWRICTVRRLFDIYTKDLKTKIAAGIEHKSVAEHIVETHNTEIAHLIDRPNLHGKRWCWRIFDDLLIDMVYVPVIIIENDPKHYPQPKMIKQLPWSEGTPYFKACEIAKEENEKMGMGYSVSEALVGTWLVCRDIEENNES